VDRQTDMAKLIGALRDYANAPKECRPVYDQMCVTYCQSHRFRLHCHMSLRALGLPPRVGPGSL
jgi:hypothetical protein